MLNICRACEESIRCPYVEHHMEYNCYKMGTPQRHFSDGYKLAIKDVVEWLHDWCDKMSVLDGHDIEELKTYMEDKCDDEEEYVAR